MLNKSIKKSHQDIIRPLTQIARIILHSDSFPASVVCITSTVLHIMITPKTQMLLNKQLNKSYLNNPFLLSVSDLLFLISPAKPLPYQDDDGGNHHGNKNQKRKLLQEAALREDIKYRQAECHSCKQEESYQLFHLSILILSVALLKNTQQTLINFLFRVFQG